MLKQAFKAGSAAALKHFKIASGIDDALVAGAGAMPFGSLLAPAVERRVSEYSDPHIWWGNPTGAGAMVGGLGGQVLAQMMGVNPLLGDMAGGAAGAYVGHKKNVERGKKREAEEAATRA